MSGLPDLKIWFRTRTTIIFWNDVHRVRLESPFLVLNIFPPLVSRPDQSDIFMHNFMDGGATEEFMMRIDIRVGWPFVYSDLNLSLAWRASDFIYGWIHDHLEVEVDLIRSLQLAHLRFDRRMLRRAKKCKGKINNGDIVLHPYYTTTMPGGWID